MFNKYTEENLINNKLIVEFLGCKSVITYENKITGHKEYNVKSPLVSIWREKFGNTGGFDNSMMLQNTRFHNSWDWLNEVIDKIISLRYTVQFMHEKWDNVSVLIVHIYDNRRFMNHNKPRYNNRIDNDDYHNHDNGLSNIELAYNEIVKFIKWYNNQKNERN